MSSISQNLQLIYENIRKNSAAPEKVRILGVSKYQSVERILEAVNLGVNLLGVNYVQEGQKLREELKKLDIEWHFIGHIQSRKAKLLLDYDCIHSIDRLDVAEDLNHRAQELEKILNILVEVNIGHEPQKSGVMPENLEDFLTQLGKFQSLAIKGLMSMPPPVSMEERRPYFREVKRLYDRFSKIYPMDTLSAGTSEDYPIALQEGANLIRLGTCLFGSRPLKSDLPN